MLRSVIGPAWCPLSLGAEVKAGPELDILVAKHVFGIVKKDGYWQKTSGYPGENMVVDAIPKYSEDMSAAWTVADKLGQWHNFGFMILRAKSYRSEELVWRAGWVEHSFGEYEWRADGESADSVATAICLAALKAVGAL